MVGRLWQVLGWLFPPHCAGCGTTAAWWCDDCDAQVSLIRAPECHLCRALTPRGEVCRRCRRRSSLTGLLAGARYRPPLDEAVRALKYRHAKVLAPLLARYQVIALARMGPLRRAVLVPVPLYWRRERQRGHNQADLLTEVLHQASGLPVSRKLQRIRNTGSQTAKTRRERQANMRDAFWWEGRAPHSVILVDDVATTGATLEAAAKACRAAGARIVWGLVVAQR